MARTERLLDPRLGEEAIRRVYPSGFTVYAVRKPQFTKSYATVATRYGSVDTRLLGRPLPDGVAHFLEHKVFETPEGDAFDLFAARGASANAFTSFGSTRYLFGTSRDFAGSLRVLLEMVFDLHVSEASVEKERGIIGQEIAMYDDDPDWRIYFGALHALYRRHPVRIDIAGTRRTIGTITAPLLREIHARHYHPRRMALAVVSPEPPEVAFRVVEEVVEPRRYGPPAPERPILRDEPRKAGRGRFRARLPIARPRVMFAFKDRPIYRAGNALLRRELATAIGLDGLFGNSGSIFSDLYERGLVDETFSYQYTAEPDYAFALAGGETDDAGRLQRELDRCIRAALGRGIPPEEFERVRNKAFGDYARAFNAPESIAHMLVSHHLRGTVLADYLSVLSEIRREEVSARLRELLQFPSRTVSVVVPR